jgi:hypothetical protein
MSNDIQFFNSDQVPQPKSQIKIEDLALELYPDRRRIWINIKVTPFQERPNLFLVARNTDDVIVGELSIIETMHADMEFTLHIRNVDEPAGDYELVADLFYETRNPPQDQHRVTFSIPAEDEMTS